MARPDCSALRKHLDSRMQRLDETRRPWLEGCRLIAEQLFPSRLPFLIDPTSAEKAGQHNAHIVDAVGFQSLGTTAAGIVSGAMPATSPWYDLMVRGQYDPDDQQRDFLQQVAYRQRTAHNQSNANQALGVYAMELIAFGTSVGLFLEDDEDFFRIDTLSVGEYWIAEDHRGRPDTIFRRLSMTVAQLAEEFGKEALSPQAITAYERHDYDFAVPVIHAIEPDRDTLNPYGRNADQPWRSVYYEEGSRHEDVLAVRGYARFPALVTRWVKLNGTPYGIGRGMDALPHLVRLRQMIYRYGQAMANKADPPLQLPPGVAAHEVKGLPGGRTAVLGDQPIRSLYDVRIDLRELDEAIERTRQDIRDSLGATLVSSLRSLTHQMTAREVDTRTSQDLLEFLPAIYQLFEELIEPLVQLEWDALARAGQLPEIPEGMPEDVDIEYTSPLARKQRQVEVDAILRVFQMAGEMAAAAPQILENLDFDRAIRIVAEIEGAPVDALTKLEKMREMRAARQQAEQAETRAAAAERGVEFARAAGEAQRAVSAA